MLKKASLKKIVTKQSLYIIGLNSGTSADGIDAALIKIAGNGAASRIRFIKGTVYPYKKSLKNRIKQCAAPEFDSAKAWLELDCQLAELFACATLKLIKSAKLKPENIDLIGSHGQTIRHLSQTKYGSISHQLADPTRIAAITGITTIGDFRVADTAVGGQGAPLTPIVNGILFGKLPGVSAVLNIGGIANISLIRKQGGKLKIFGCDTGPGNMVIDYLANKLFKIEYDKDGGLASRGLPNWGIVNGLASGQFFEIKGPKSAGREEFGERYAERAWQICKRHGLSVYDTMATVSMLTAIGAQKCAKINRLRFDRLIVSGGGARNSYLMKALEKLFLPAKCIKVDSLGYSGDYLEAISFAILANETVNSNRYDLSAVTGAEKSIVLGKICQA